MWESPPPVRICEATFLLVSLCASLHPTPITGTLHIGGGLWFDRSYTRSMEFNFLAQDGTWRLDFLGPYSSRLASD